MLIDGLAKVAGTRNLICNCFDFVGLMRPAPGHFKHLNLSTLTYIIGLNRTYTEELCTLMLGECFEVCLVFTQSIKSVSLIPESTC